MGITHRENLEECKDRIVFTFDKEKVTEVVNDIAEVVGKQSPIKGFRKGKAPIHAIKSVAKKFILKHAEQKLANEAFADILFETKMKPFGPPHITKMEASYDLFTIDMNVGYYPEISTIKYKDFQLVEPTDLPDKDSIIQKSLENFRKQYPVLRVFDENEFVMDGDSVIIDYIGILDGKEIENTQGVPIEIGANHVVRDFEINMFGMKLGETREFNVDFPEGTGKFTGKMVSFKVTLNSGVKKDLPDLNDELAQKAGFKTVDEIMVRLDEQSNKSIENVRKQKLKEQVIDNLFKSTNMAIPTWMLSDTAKGIARNHKIEFEKVEEEVREKLLEESAKVIKLNVIFETIKEEEKETVLSNEEIMNIIKHNENNFPADVQAALQNKNTSDAMLTKLFSEIQDEQIFTWIIDHSEVTKDTENAES